LLSTIYLISYCGAALPAMAAGELARFMSLTQVAEAYAALGVVAALVAMVAIQSGTTRASTVSA
jgi:hypothetical protein